MPSADSRLSTQDSPPRNPPLNPCGGSLRNCEVDSVSPVAKSIRTIELLSQMVRTLPSVDNTPGDWFAQSCFVTLPVSTLSRQSFLSLFRRRDLESGVNPSKLPYEMPPINIRCLSRPVGISQMLRLPSELKDARSLPSGEPATPEIGAPCCSRVLPIRKSAPGGTASPAWASPTTSEGAAGLP